METEITAISLLKADYRKILEGKNWKGKVKSLLTYIRIMKNYLEAMKFKTEQPTLLARSKRIVMKGEMVFNYFLNGFVYFLNRYIIIERFTL